MQNFVVNIHRQSSTLTDAEIAINSSQESSFLKNRPCKNTSLFYFYVKPWLNTSSSSATLQLFNNTSVAKRGCDHNMFEAIWHSLRESLDEESCKVNSSPKKKNTCTLRNTVGRL
ncbi:hypothetical protein Ocin01_15788 [Orchesella cincta]|uniref:Uncharacterized protein n=1 Tax=Orchesella cincta TaxID=48709 RepID=A0A1D2MDF4_ORCCI|nr:hypothetical protein Ocin01_15788 [Orchesella cincta]